MKGQGKRMAADLSSGRSDVGLQVGAADSGHLEGEPALAADLGDGDGLPHPLDLTGLLLGSLATDGDSKRRPGHVLVGKLEVDDVESRLRRLVGDVEGSVLVVFAFDLGLAWTLDGEGEAAVSGILRVDGESVVLGTNRKSWSTYWPFNCCEHLL